MQKIVVFASGSGTNFQSVIDAIKQGSLRVHLSGLITSRQTAGALDRAAEAGIPSRVINPSGYSGTDRFCEALLEQLQVWKPDLIVLAGYMVRIPDGVLRAYPGKIINIHPALLPKFGGKGYYGLNVHQAVLESGDTETGCTVHIVNEAYDQGPILAQRKVAVEPGDTPAALAERVLKAEHKLLPEIIQQLLNQKD